jgi:DNA-binding NarL/FixJ family response regulator
MSLKLHYRPGGADRSPFSDLSPSGDADSLASRIHQIQTSARQICSEAADIEDARFLAESILAACRQILANGSGDEANATNHRQGKRPADRPDLARVPSLGSPNAARARAAAEKLSVLTERELEIFTHLAEGCSAADISVKLSRSGKTINNHRTRILHKLGLKNATELVRLAASAGVISV